MNIKPIKSKKDYKATLKFIENLWDSKPGSKEADKLDILVTLVESWEVKNTPIAPPTPIEAIKFRMDQEGLKNSDVAHLFGGRNRVSEILNGQRSLTVKSMQQLHKKLKVPAESLLA